MLIFLDKPATKDEIKKASKDLDGYIKVTIDIGRGLTVIGGRLHVDAEKMLLEDGSRQDDIWGGGYDILTKQIDFISMINLRPSLGNLSEEIIIPEIRLKFEKLLKKFLNLD